MSKSHINKAQAVCLETYASGDFSHLLELKSEKSFEAALAECGDSLLRFLMIELSSSEDCDSPGTAANRIANAIADLSAVQQAIEALPGEDSPTTAAQAYGG